MEIKGFFVRLCIIFSVVMLFFATGACAADKRKSHKIMHMPSNKIAEFVKATAGEKRIVMIYTSWCPFCRQILPNMMDIERIKPGSVIAISEDGDYVKFVNYINQYSDVPFMIILNKPMKSKNLPHSLAPMGIKKWKGYPNFILLDKENKIVGQGNFEADELASFIFEEE